MKLIVSLLMAVVATSVATVAAKDHTMSTVGAGLSAAEYWNTAAAPAAAISTDESLPSSISRLGSPEVKESDCNYYVEETCYDETGDTVVSCARYDEGGCPCHDGEAKCGGDEYWPGYCTALCCDWETEETCYDEVTWDALSCARHDEGGCPCPDEGDVKCGAGEYYAGYCAAVCCDWETEETCYDEVTWEELSCARHDEGGCPCPDDEAKCGANDFYGGFCTAVCCDWDIEDTCYDEVTWDALSCARYDEGGCPCPDESDVKCGATDTWSGYCAAVCCDWETEETCYDEVTWEELSCARHDEGGCPSSRSDISLTTKTTPLLKVKEMAKEATLFRAFELREREALAKNAAHKHAVKREEKEEEVALFRATKLREKALAKKTALSRAIKLREKAALAKKPAQSHVIKRKAKDEEAALLRATKLREKELLKKVSHTKAAHFHV